MTTASGPRWKRMCADETREVKKVLRAEFEQAGAYRYNSASIRVRVIDSRFEGRSVEERDAMVELHLRRLPERTQADIINLFTFAPSELEGTEKTLRAALLNLEFEYPSPSEL